jgi:hypothetical protein
MPQERRQPLIGRRLSVILGNEKIRGAYSVREECARRDEIGDALVLGIRNLGRPFVVRHEISVLHDYSISIRHRENQRPCSDLVIWVRDGGWVIHLSNFNFYQKDFEVDENVVEKVVVAVETLMIVIENS